MDSVWNQRKWRHGPGHSASRLSCFIRRVIFWISESVIKMVTEWEMENFSWTKFMSELTRKKQQDQGLGGIPFCERPLTLLTGRIDPYSISEFALDHNLSNSGCASRPIPIMKEALPCPNAHSHPYPSLFMDLGCTHPSKKGDIPEWKKATRVSARREAFGLGLSYFLPRVHFPEFPIFFGMGMWIQNRRALLEEDNGSTTTKERKRDPFHCVNYPVAGLCLLRRICWRDSAHFPVEKESEKGAKNLRGWIGNRVSGLRISFIQEKARTQVLPYLCLLLPISVTNLGLAMRGLSTFLLSFRLPPDVFSSVINLK